MDNIPNMIHSEPAEYDLYYNYISKFHNGRVILRKIKWNESPANSGENNVINKDYSIFETQKNKGLKENCNYVAFHSYDRDLNY